MDAEALRQAGWRQTPPGGFTNHAGPFWLRFAADGVEAALPIEAHHCNEHLGVLHGGVVTTFADVALGARVASAAQAPYIATVQLNVHFVASGKRGELMTCKPDLVRKTARLVFVRGLIEAGGRTIANADGVWSVLEPKQERA